MAVGRERVVVDQEEAGAFPLFGPGRLPVVMVDSADDLGVVRVATDLQADIERVCGRRPLVSMDAVPRGALPVYVGTVGKSKFIQRLAAAGKIDVSRLKGQWEAGLVQVVNDPEPGVKQGLVVAGSDKRGTIYGVYTLSEQMGVNPWYWWADVPVRHRDALWVKAGVHYQASPKVKYRGIFINDEGPSLSNWVYKFFGEYRHQFYEKVFELLLRLKANYLWPAMWNNCFSQDDPLNMVLADQYGIVMGTSHVERMMRADKEWNRLGYLQDDWNYLTHPTELERYWRDGVVRNKPYESITTIAMRGKIDTPMTETANIALLEKIVAAQRKILAENVNKDITKIPQLWALYKEVQEYYEKGMRVPDDVTLLWCDDNWGNIRRLPSPDERGRSGGAGVYYHFDYVGGPRNYKWINTSPLPKIWEQMNLAYHYGADRIWIVNVGDIKPMEVPISFFLDMAWDPVGLGKERIEEWTREWAAAAFGGEHSAGIADVIAKYAKYNARRKPELLAADTFSVENYGEAWRIDTQWRQLGETAEALGERLPASDQDAYFQLVLFPVRAAETVNRLWVAVGRNRAAGKLGLAVANEYADEARRLFELDGELKRKYHSIGGGKWDHMMDQTHISYTGWQQPDKDELPRLETVVNGKVGELPLGGASWGGEALPNSRGGFLETDRCVAIEPHHFTRKVDQVSKWEEIPDYGRTSSGMSVFPVMAAPAEPGKGACLEYDVSSGLGGEVTVHTVLGPTLAFQPKRGLRIAVSFDGEAPQVVDAPARYLSPEWEESVRTNSRPVLTKHKLTPGQHTLKIWAVDPGLVLQRILIDFGGLKPSYLGPPESPRV